jgi:hypothetical protein
MSKFIRTAILTFLIATPLLFTVLACLFVGPFGLAVPAWVIWRVRRQVARENAALNPVVYELVEFYGPSIQDTCAPKWTSTVKPQAPTRFSTTS